MNPASETLLAWAHTALALLWTTTIVLTVTALALSVLAVLYALAHLHRTRRPRPPRHFALPADVARLDDARQRRRHPGDEPA